VARRSLDRAIDGNLEDWQIARLEQAYSATPSTTPQVSAQEAAQPFGQDERDNCDLICQALDG
jgi:hypothetical protein